MSAKTALAAVLLAVSGLTAAQTVPTIFSSPEGGVQPGPVTPDDPLPAKLIAVDPGAASFVAEYNATIEAFYNEMTTYHTVVDGYCVAIPMTRKLFSSSRSADKPWESAKSFELWQPFQSSFAAAEHAAASRTMHGKTALLWWSSCCFRTAYLEPQFGTPWTIRKTRCVGLALSLSPAL